MPVLAIETSTEAGSVAFVKNGSLLGEVRIRKPFAQSRNLIQAIDALRRFLELETAAVDAIAVSIGPGSYTGLRIGLSVAKGLAFSWDKPLVAVNSLDALAQQGRVPERRICSCIRFRKNQYYAAFYRHQEDDVVRESDYFVAEFAELLESMERPGLLLGILRPEEEHLVSVSPEPEQILYWRHAVPSAYWVGLLGERAYHQGITEDVATVTPFYMHDFPVQPGKGGLPSKG
jgi:tRNA threonylcarbamoyl adenosine modification protein YeaZ